MQTILKWRGLTRFAGNGRSETAWESAAIAAFCCSVSGAFCKSPKWKNEGEGSDPRNRRSHPRDLGTGHGQICRRRGRGDQPAPKSTRSCSPWIPPPTWAARTPPPSPASSPWARAPARLASSGGKRSKVSQTARRTRRKTREDHRAWSSCVRAHQLTVKGLGLFGAVLFTWAFMLQPVN